MNRTQKFALALGILGLATAAEAGETITYGYDELGRLIQVSHAGTVNPGVAATYGYDPADNRSSVTVVTSGGGGGSAAASQPAKSGQIAAVRPGVGSQPKLLVSVDCTGKRKCK